MAEIKNVLVPDIGNFKDVSIIEVAVKAGDMVSAEQSLISLETDKATIDVPAPFAGVVKEVKVKAGDKVSEGSLIVTLETSGDTAQAAAAPVQPVAAPVAPAAKPAPAVTPVAAAPAAAPAISAAGSAHASPSIRRFARELGVDLSKVGGSGEKGRVTKDDVQNFVKKSLAGGGATSAGGALPGLLPWPDVDYAKFGAVESKPLSRIKKISGANLHRNWVMIPHVTQFEEADISEMEAFRKELGAEYVKENFKITPLAFMLKACAITLKHFPDFCASLDAAGENLVLKKYIHIGVAVDTPDGLMVPVIRDVDQKGIVQLAKELGEVSAKAREKKITAADMQGGCFTISSLGGIGGTSFTPIINAPEVAILGVSRSSMKPVWKDGEFVPRLMLPLSLSYDHRVIDGAAGARFTTYLAHVLSDMRRLAL
ncbi:dihydrolipoyllysine-residue acetyltransferase [Sideroxydans lithotrophicus]|uniref:Acetyltransferase component of pyruvate dehydrogenase complex n=1 Tax=Sideroxydans lithotrophicus (strain ES-1) TaxID=580332 RepID=D5CPH7_SIDLE|nr:dihydrolipoyllysine-residue acetyltransferase [Sideroxydans lithotrophicus]ADE12972.1 pyruvate dehydrogenase complex dihydrolipoamide acetyltransferase [Sideroxydans lithotrophicus ES-1]